MTLWSHFYHSRSLIFFCSPHPSSLNNLSVKNYHVRWTTKTFQLAGNFFLLAPKVWRSVSVFMYDIVCICTAFYQSHFYQTHSNVINNDLCTVYTCCHLCGPSATALITLTFDLTLITTIIMTVIAQHTHPSKCHVIPS